MTVQQICNNIELYRGTPSDYTFFLHQESLTADDAKAIRSSAVIFNLTTTAHMRCTFETRRATVKKEQSEIQLGRRFWGSLVLLISSVSLSIFGTYFYGRYLVRSYRQAALDCASGKYAIYNSYNIRVRSATVWDLMKGPVSGGFLGVFGALATVIKTFDIFDHASRDAFTKRGQAVTVSFKTFQRELPNPLSNANNKSDLTDPISYEEFPRDQACLPRYLHVANTVIGLSNCVKAILQKDLEHDQVNVPRFQHPLEGYRLEIDDTFKLEEEISDTLCIPFNLRNFKSGLYDCWEVEVSLEEIRQEIRRTSPDFPIDSYPDLNHTNVLELAITTQKALTQRKRELKFLSFFDQRVYEFLPAFVPPQAHERV